MKLLLFLKKHFRNLLLISNILFAVLLLLAYSAAFISPVNFYPVAFLGLIYPFLLIVNLAICIIWSIQRSRLFLISLISILLGWNFLGSIFQFSFGNEKVEKNSKSFKVLSYNVRVFDLWRWSDEKNRAARIFHFIKNSRSDIVCLQEFYSKKKKGKDAEDSLLTNSTLKYRHIVYTSKNNKKTNYGIAIFSGFPIVSKGSVKINAEDNYCIFSDIVIQSDTLRVYNLHLESIHLGEKDYELIENFKNEDSINVSGLKQIYWKLKKSYKKRAKQVESIVEHMKNCRYSVVLCGDLNDTPLSYAYRQLTRTLSDAFRRSGNGIGSTYINKFYGFRIDYILHSNQLNSNHFISPKVKLSDHYPVQCVIEMK